ncbi:glycerophosphodiester phosphodiesterase family protein [Streptomyces sp. NBC_00160]|uniref:glycerophosphodiester phosphodiesterase n=1 Tax=Streptomyces sp. NBC_00160 TaxID=2903628 RepID=UPI00225C2760|nr:glycerophosphodiester phosphodiesterase family protein [Streptomyces sp. NBC_00160]MCX5306680.1 glycerophosphodiester phosphodiesterase family protein [Streptomyces sp. NBC_00160]
MYVRPAAAAAAAFLGFTLTLLGGTASYAATGPGSAAGTGTGTGAKTGRAALGGPVVYAHRGASAYAPENTLDAIDLAMQMGFDWVENDVQRTKDGVLVVIHDDTLARTTDVEQRFPDRAPWKVQDFTAAEIARLDAGSWFGDEYAGASVPTLRQYLDRVQRNRQKLLLEIKKPELYPGIEEQTLKVLEEAGWLDARHVAQRLVVQSFSADSVRIVHGLRPDLVTAFLGTPAVADLPRYAEFTDRINPWHTTISADWVSAVHGLLGAHGKAMEVDTWIVDDAATARKVQDMGVDGIITNAPDVVQDAVGGF